jgi:hypothetical protein
MDKYLPELLIVLAAAAISGMTALLINGLRDELKEIKGMICGMVTKEICEARRSKMETDINNIGTIVRTVKADL